MDYNKIVQQTSQIAVNAENTKYILYRNSFKKLRIFHAFRIHVYVLLLVSFQQACFINQN